MTSPLDPRSRPFVGGLALALAHAVAFGLAFPPFDAALLVLLAPLPLILLASWTTGPWRSALATLLGTAPMWFWHHWWIADVSSAALPGITLYLGLWPALFVLICARVRTRWNIPVWTLAPIVWIGLEVLRGEVVFTGYPWFLIAHPLIDLPPIAQAAPIFGAYGVGFVVLLIPTLLAAHLVHGWAQSRFALVATMFCAIVLGMPGDAPEVEGRARIVVVQTAVPQDNKSAWTFAQREQDFVRAVELTLAARDRWPDADLILWPETMFPGIALDADALNEVRTELARADGLSVTPFADAVESLGRGSLAGTPWMIGAIGYDGLDLAIDDSTGAISESWDARYNSLFLVEGGLVSDRYDKQHLAPFGEVLPYVRHWPWLERLVMNVGAQGMSFDLASGDERTILSPAGSSLRVAAPICFEAGSTAVCRALVFDDDGGRRANLLVNPTNDGWFAAHPGGRGHHLLLARWRAAELRTPMVRAANTGISVGIGRDGGLLPGSFIDESGAIVSGRAGVDEWGALMVDVELGDGQRPAWRGGLIAWVLGGLAVIGAIASVVPKPRSRRPAPGDAS